MKRTTLKRARAATILAAASLVCALSLSAGSRAAVGARLLAAAQERVELPAGADVRVENQRGGVTVEVWGENFLSVEVLTGDTADAAGASGAAGVAGAAGAGGAGVKPPFLIERAGNSVTVVVARLPGRASGPRVDLLVRLPTDARLRVFTTSGAVEARGATALFDAQTVSGDLRLWLPRPPDADVMARTLRGTITVRDRLAPGGGAVQILKERFGARLGAGRSLVRLSSSRGSIELSTTDAPVPPPRAVVSSPAGQSASRSRVAPRASDGDIATTPAATPTPATTRAQNATRTNAPSRRNRPTLAGAPAPTPAPSPSLARAQNPPATPAPRSTPATPAQEFPIEVDPDEIITVDTHVVTLNMSVVNRQSGRGLSGLAQGDFRIFEDNVEQQISHFETSAAPFDLLLVVDLSGSTARLTEIVRAAALRFVASVRPRDRVGVLAFASTPTVVSPLTEDRQLLRSRLEALGAPQGDTKLYDAADFALTYLSENSPKSRRRAVVLMSDGLDSVLPNVQGEGSALGYDELRRRVQEFDGLFYTVWLDNSYDALSPQDIQPETFDLVYDRMEELSKLGGGLFYEVAKIEDLAGAYERVVEDLGTVYSLSYIPTNKTRDNRWRTVRVRLPRHPEAVARGRNGYFAK